MTTSDTAPEAPPRASALQRKVALSSLLGTVIEYYDFLLYSTMAALVFGKVFFPAGDPAAATIAAFGTLAAGYVARPLGGLLFGHFGDRLGRKSTLVVTMMLMGGASFLIGLLPGYATIGAAAPVLLVVLRVVQGIAVGGEYGGAALMVVEHADADRRGFWAGIMQLGSPFGFLLSTLAVTVVTQLPAEDFVAWGWRVPFLLSAVLLGVGLYVRLSVVESPVFRDAAERAPAVPLRELLRRPKLLVLACAAGIGPFALTALISTHSIAYATSIGYAAQDVIRTLLYTVMVSIVLIPLASALTDRLGRRVVPLVGAGAAVLFAWPMYAMIDSGSLLWFTVALMIAQAIQNIMYAPLTPLLTEMFGTEVRYSGVSVGYQFASLLGAGFTPVIASSLVAATGGSSLPLTGIVVVAALITLVAVLGIAETRGRDLRNVR